MTKVNEILYIILVNNNFNDDLDEFDLGFFKMNNKVNLNKFQSKDGYHTDEGSI